MLAYEVGDEFMEAWYEAEAGKLDPFVLVVEGSIPNEKINGEGHWAGHGRQPRDRPADHHQRVARPPGAEGGGGRGRRAPAPPTAGIPAMKNNPTGAMGVPDYLGWE